MIEKMEQTRLRLRYLREVKKYSYREIAKEIGIGKSTIYDFVSGKTIVQLRTFLKIEEYVTAQMKKVCKNNKYTKSLSFNEWLKNQ